MPDLEPVSHDPFATQLMPVNGDPFAGMTHQSDQTAQPYMHPNVPAAARAIAGFATGGLQGAGVPLPDWAASNPVQRALQNPDNTSGIGATLPIGTLQKLLNKGLSYSQIGKELGVSRNVVAGNVRDLGLSAKQGKEPYVSEIEKSGFDSSYFSKQSRDIGRGYRQQPSMPKFKFNLEPVQHDPFAAENERIFGYKEP